MIGSGCIYLERIRRCRKHIVVARRFQCAAHSAEVSRNGVFVPSPGAAGHGRNGGEPESCILETCSSMDYPTFAGAMNLTNPWIYKPRTRTENEVGPQSQSKLDLGQRRLPPQQTISRKWNDSNASSRSLVQKQLSLRTGPTAASGAVRYSGDEERFPFRKSLSFTHHSRMSTSMFKILRAVFAISLTLSLSFAATRLSGIWSNWRGPIQNGVSDEKGLPSSWSPEGENLVWKVPIGGRSAPVVLGDRLYLVNIAGEGETEQEQVVCLDACLLYTSPSPRDS